MHFKIQLAKVLDICDPREFWPWQCKRPSKHLVEELLSKAALVENEIIGSGSADVHIGRIRYLALNGWRDPIDIDVGVPCIGYEGPSWPVTDGNHRLWAATIRGDAFINVCISGDVNHAKKIFCIASQGIS